MFLNTISKIVLIANLKSVTYILISISNTVYRIYSVLGYKGFIIIRYIIYYNILDISYINFESVVFKNTIINSCMFYTRILL